ncbi:L,D-transpeptidase [Aurantimonas sp. VKM B-3413]|uniref:L,D-transpeptidase n=1 Tax=Aurantimonas sp. VKM B-3413 TaxID=2779401 RepID=UPI001E444577|nr:L,D-transpeptidase [Aurantimonas sp. VKM B-3413]MCB8838719.1 L,D-transpeptidase [Aurantimonas sp. VKM B-3413]
MQRISTVLAALLAAATTMAASQASAGERYRDLPPVQVAPGLQRAWLLQLAAPSGVVLDAARPQTPYRAGPAPAARSAPPSTGRAAYAYAAPAARPAARAAPALDPVYLPQVVAYDGKEAPGTIVIDSGARFLYLVGRGGKARRYGVGVGKPGFGWSGTHRISRKAEWPGWTPPAEMIARERRKGRELPGHMDGGMANPLGARALYLGSTLYRIHGTNAPWTIGQFVSSGCIRMRNQDVMDLYDRVAVGTKVVVL